ncbi:hypothetical protein AVEN_115321-1 [Araneus ventricosus]|uniref:Reverse transcriptase/retrotransposon-derived protein RNase H-like domain-containing protein n=1 Tax=Araneus ventricosus TaxID=182803 RepID=A0A4Y1ZY10_ARAVE|nr:hypothetical protein AVEN_115321-1 [Araneus ventricosus]
MSKGFRQIKGKLVERPVLHAPDCSRQFIIQVDSSNTGTGVVLCQRDEKGEKHPILYLSRKFIKAELNYCTTEKILEEDRKRARARFSFGDDNERLRTEVSSPVDGRLPFFI